MRPPADTLRYWAHIWAQSASAVVIETLFGNQQGQTMPGRIFHEGERVRLAHLEVPNLGRLTETPSNPRWGGYHGHIEGTVIEALQRESADTGRLPLRVRWDNGETNSYDDLHLMPSPAPTQQTQPPPPVQPVSPQRAFQVYDMVTLNNPTRSDYRLGPSNPVWGGAEGHVVGVIVDMLSPSSIRVRWENGQTNTYGAGDLSQFYMSPTIDEAFQLPKEQSSVKTFREFIKNKEDQT